MGSLARSASPSTRGKTMGESTKWSKLGFINRGTVAKSMTIEERRILAKKRCVRPRSLTYLCDRNGLSASQIWDSLGTLQPQQLVVKAVCTHQTNQDTGPLSHAFPSAQSHRSNSATSGGNPGGSLWQPRHWNPTQRADFFSSSEGPRFRHPKSLTT